MKWKNGIPFSSLSAAIFSSLPSLGAASDNPFNSLFHPLQYLDLGTIYDLYHHWIDFFIFLCLFVSVTRFTLGRRFVGKEGQALSVVVGLALALSLSLLEYKAGFSIKSFGPIATGILILVVVIVIFYLIKAIGAGNSGAGSFAFVVTYFLVRATLPDLVLSLEGNSWFVWLDLGLMVAVLISIWKIIGSLLSGRDMKSFGRVLERSRSPENTNLRRNINDEKREISLIKRDLRRITKEGMKEGGNIHDRLLEILRIIGEFFGNTDKARRLIAEKINQIVPKDNLIAQRLRYLINFSKQIQDFDLELFKELQARWDQVPEKERDIIKEEILIEKNKILSEKKLVQLETTLSKYDNDFRYCLSWAVDCLRSNQPAQARDWLLKAIKCEEGAMNIFQEMEKIEGRLVKLTKREFKTFKREMKDEKG